jgi:hypothetical protein
VNYTLSVNINACDMFGNLCVLSVSEDGGGLGAPISVDVEVQRGVNEWFYW